jgi:hypothetical protein
LVAEGEADPEAEAEELTKEVREEALEVVPWAD